MPIGWNRGERHHRRMSNKNLDTAQPFCKPKQFARGHYVCCTSRRVIFQTEINNSTEVLLLLPGNFIMFVRWQARIVNLTNFGTSSKPMSYCQSIFSVLLDAKLKGFKPADEQP